MFSSNCRCTRSTLDLRAIHRRVNVQIADAYLAALISVRFIMEFFFQTRLIGLAERELPPDSTVDVRSNGRFKVLRNKLRESVEKHTD